MAVHYDVLIIDDNADDYELCQRMLCGRYRNAGDEFTFQLRHAKNGQQGLHDISQHNPHCVLLDYSLPGSDGLAVLHEIRKQDTLVPVIVLTGQGSENLAVSLLKAGAQDYLVKSEIRNHDLRKTVLHAIELTRAKVPSVKKDLSSLCVLIVDDNVDDRELVRRTLTKVNNGHYIFFEAASGAEVLPFIETHGTVCVLLDYSLPGENGLDVLKKISDRFPFIPVIIFSGQGSENVAAEAIKNGAFHYLVKSEITPELLDKTIRQALEKKQLEYIVYEKNQEVKRHQYEAIARKKRFDRVVQATNIVVWEYDIANDRLHVEEQIEALFGEALEESHITLQQIRDRVHPDDIATLDAVWQAHLRDASNELDIAYRLRHKNGSWRWIRETGKIVAMNSAGNPSQVAGLYQDISKKKYEEDVLNRLYTITIDSDLSLEQKVSEVLHLGLNYLGLELGLVSRIHDDIYEIIHCEPKGPIASGQMFSYSRTYCSHVFGTNEVRAWNRAGNSDICAHACYQEQMFETYIGTSLFLNQKPYGTLAFIQKAQRQHPFSSREKTVLRLMAQWMSSEITRHANLKEIEASNTFLQLVQDSIPDLIFVKDEQFRIVRANPAFLNVYPASARDAVIGSTTVESYNEEEAEAFLMYDKIALQEGYSETEETIRFPDGKERTLHTKKTRFQDAENNRFILGVGRDVSERKEAEARIAESEERYELAVRGSSVGLWDWSVKTGELFWSDRFKEIIGISDEDFRPRYEEFSERLHPEDKEAIEKALFSHVKYQTPYDVEYRLRKTDDTYVWIHARGQAIWDEQGNATRMAGSVDDITVSKEAQEEVLRSNAELERFAYMASHDLQEPLRMVSNFTQLLEKQYSEKLDARALEYIEYASSGAVRMQRLVRDLLEYARIGNEAESFELIDLNGLKTSIQENLSASIEHTEAVIEWAVLPAILAEPVRISSVFQNLIGNAIKYRKPDVAPKISITAELVSEQWIFSVSDNGIGMKQQYCEKIFEPFKRLHRKEEYSGTGMGLTICRKIIERLGGKIWATSELGQGSTFHFSLPRQRAH